MSKQTMVVAKAYILRHWVWGLVAGYFLVSVVLYLGYHINVLIPCLFTALLGVHCPGCGLTTAFLHLLSADVAAAWAANPMIFVVLPAGSFFMVRDWLRFRKQYPHAAATR